jgi:peptidoglycan/xylan/chitin deacetylase (PgdA/CDA1 family)
MNDKNVAGASSSGIQEQKSKPELEAPATHQTRRLAGTRFAFSICALLGALLVLTSCSSFQSDLPQSTTLPPVRFLLTFDDGPSIREDYNSTLAIIQQLATNDVQPGVKAIFFVQTEHPRGGGTPRGREIMRFAHEQGHVIGIHSTSPRGHVAHITLSTEVLIRELRQAKEVIRNATGSAPQLLRPPYGACDVRTRTIYADLGLNVLMSDVRARDGIIYFWNFSLKRRSHIYDSLKSIRRTANPAVISCVIVNFHDVNPYTARHMTEYLHILVEEARHAGLAVADKPFYDDADEIVRVAVSRRLPPPEHPLGVMPPGAPR